MNFAEVTVITRFTTIGLPYVRFFPDMSGTLVAHMRQGEMLKSASMSGILE